MTNEETTRRDINGQTMRTLKQQQKKRQENKMTNNVFLRTKWERGRGTGGANTSEKDKHTEIADNKDYKRYRHE